MSYELWELAHILARAAGAKGIDQSRGLLFNRGHRVLGVVAHGGHISST